MFSFTSGSTFSKEDLQIMYLSLEKGDCPAHLLERFRRILAVETLKSVLPTFSSSDYDDFFDFLSDD